jgi:hypothetical protein
MSVNIAQRSTSRYESRSLSDKCGMCSVGKGEEEGKEKKEKENP